MDDLISPCEVSDGHAFEGYRVYIVNRVEAVRARRSDESRDTLLASLYFPNVETLGSRPRSAIVRRTW